MTTLPKNRLLGCAAAVLLFGAGQHTFAKKPEEPLFEVAPRAVFRGRVVNAVTGKPIDGAFVIGTQAVRWLGPGLGALSREAWQELHALPKSPPKGSPAFSHIAESYNFNAVVRTDKEGRYELERQEGENIYSLLAFEEDFVPFSWRVAAVKIDAHGKGAIPDIPLVPAATVRVKPVFQGKGLSVLSKWRVLDSGVPEWYRRLRPLMDTWKCRFESGDWMRLDVAQRRCIPAGLNLRVVFECSYEEDDDEFVPREFPQVLCLQQGQILDIGELTFIPALPITVAVVDKRGGPVENVSVRRLNKDDDVWSINHDTDSRGIARLHMKPESEGWLRVSKEGHRSTRDTYLTDKIPFSIGATAPAEPVTIVLADDKVRIAMKPEPEIRIRRRGLPPGDDGLYGIRRLASDDPSFDAVVAHDGSVLRIIRKLDIGVQKACFNPTNNASSVYNVGLTTEKYDCRISLALRVGDTIYMPRSMGGDDGWCWHISFEGLSAEYAARIAQWSGVPLPKREHPGHKLALELQALSESYAKDGEVPLLVWIRNEADAPVSFLWGVVGDGARVDQISFKAVHEGKAVSDVGRDLPKGHLCRYVTLRPGVFLQQIMDLRQWFALDKPGKYDISAEYTIEIHELMTPGEMSPKSAPIWTDVLTANIVVEIAEPDK